MFEEENQEENFDDGTVEIPIDGILDLHTFDPKDVKDLVPTYLDECLERGITEVRIIHGKGKGILRRTVRSILERHPNVISYNYGNSWGVTIVYLRN